MQQQAHAATQQQLQQQQPSKLATLARLIDLLKEKRLLKVRAWLFRV